MSVRAYPFCVACGRLPLSFGAMLDRYSILVVKAALGLPTPLPERTLLEIALRAAEEGDADVPVFTTTTGIYGCGDAEHAGAWACLVEQLVAHFWSRGAVYRESGDLHALATITADGIGAALRGHPVVALCLANVVIAHLEADIRQADRGELAAEELARRVPVIRRTNGVRLAAIYRLNATYDPCFAFPDVKIAHASSWTEELR